MASYTLDMSDDHSRRVRRTENYSRVVDRSRGDFLASQASLTALEKYLHNLCNTLNLRPTFNESFVALFAEQREYFEATHHLFDSMVSRYDRYLTVV